MDKSEQTKIDYDLSNVICGTLNEFNEQERNIFIYYLLYGMSKANIAKTLDLSPNQVRRSILSVQKKLSRRVWTE